MLLVRRTGTQARGVPLDDFVDTEPRQRLMLARRKQGGRLVSMPIGRRKEQWRPTISTHSLDIPRAL
jgi:hypothetical protein